MAVSPSGSPLRSRARTVPVSGASVAARSTLTVSAPAVLSAPASARGPATPPSITVSGRPSICLPSAVDELRATAKIDAIGEPHNLDIRRHGEETAQRRQRIRALDGMRLRLDLLQPNARRSRRLKRNVAVGLRQRDECNAAAIGLRACDQVFGGAHARVPGAGGREAVVDQQRQRGFRARRRN